MKKLNFMSGIHRSGSTLLTKILNQNEVIHATSTSPFMEYIAGVITSIDKFSVSHSSGHYFNKELLIDSNIQNFYSFTDKQNIIDKNRGWASFYENINSDLIKNPKIIYTIRPIEEVVASFYSILYKNKTPKNASEIYSSFLNDHLTLMKNSAKFKEHFCLVTYKDITENPENTLKKIEDYLGVYNHTYNFSKIEDKDPENDNAWGIKDLHSIRESISVQSINPKDIMTKSEYEYLRQKSVELYKTFGLYL